MVERTSLTFEAFQAVTCNFGDALDSSLRDQIDEALQRRLLSEAELTLAQAEKLAIAAECARSNAMEIRTTPKDVSQIHSVANDGPGPSPPAQHHAKPETKQATSVCYRCNGAHSPQDCHFKNATCLFCGRKGHIVKACLQKKAKKSPPRGCIIWGNRLVIPKVAQSTVLDVLHTAHPGIVRMKALARSTVWWPGIDHDIEEKAASCSACQEHRPSMPRAPVHPWETTQHPWSRLHIDFAGPFKGKIFLIVVDSFSKWLDVFIMKSMSSSAVVQKLRMLFAVHGVPDVIVSYNGTAFVSAEFREFTSRNQIRHVAVAPYHPSSNGQAERMVRETKEIHEDKFLQEGK
ncbi:uncharacterized protein K02A2.6-like [Ixodes scapularis]|uniref:uncharacterized protein K02A2.6-like n=1 Tax=Ixodes scapularis TaxID=6945 RepID=UPI001C38E9C5|nr:uncharacterized protein K02A2.6-like [Ixodes scapularis]